jgi:hypothetical protein
MRVRLQAGFRSFTLVPWSEATDTASELDAFAAAELRRLIVTSGEMSRALLRLIDDLGVGSGVGVAATDAQELAACVMRLLERGHLRLEVEWRAPMASQQALQFEPPTYESAPPQIIEAATHWIEIELLDEDGAPIVRERCVITRPDGLEVIERTDHFGMIRVDRILAGMCTVEFPEREAKAVGPPQLTPPRAAEPGEAHWIEIELLDEDGVAIANERCELTLPNKQVLTRKTNAKGLIRVSRIVGEGSCDVAFPDRDGVALRQ